MRHDLEMRAQVQDRIQRGRRNRDSDLRALLRSPEDMMHYMEAIHETMRDPDAREIVREATHDMDLHHLMDTTANDPGERDPEEREMPSSSTPGIEEGHASNTSRELMATLLRQLLQNHTNSP